ncbi:MAG: hypothetical protein G01um101470_712, partial [Parcubacteria group bacterium Gr01-1014_70]
LAIIQQAMEKGSQGVEFKDGVGERDRVLLTYINLLENAFVNLSKAEKDALQKYRAFLISFYDRLQKSPVFIRIPAPSLFLASRKSVVAKLADALTFNLRDTENIEILKTLGRIYVENFDLRECVENEIREKLKGLPTRDMVRFCLHIDLPDAIQELLGHAWVRNGGYTELTRLFQCDDILENFEIEERDQQSLQALQICARTIVMREEEAQRLCALVTSENGFNGAFLYSGGLTSGMPAVMSGQARYGIGDGFRPDAFVLEVYALEDILTWTKQIRDARLCSIITDWKKSQWMQPPIQISRVIIYDARDWPFKQTVIDELLPPFLPA